MVEETAVISDVRFLLFLIVSVVSLLFLTLFGVTATTTTTATAVVLLLQFSLYLLPLLPLPLASFFLQRPQLLGLELILHFIKDLGPHDDVGEGAELRHPAAAHQPRQHLQVRRPVVLGRAEPLVGARGGRQLGEEVGEVRRQGKGARPGLAGAREEGEVGVGREDVHVSRVQGRDGDPAPPEDEVLRVFADLGR